MPTSRVTVVIPTYNRAHLLQEAIQSVLVQTYHDFEILISDNASTDNTIEVVAGFKDPCIQYHRHALNIGMTANWQYVFSKVATEFVAPLADDDLYLPDHLATAVAVLDRYPHAAYYTSPAEYFGDEMPGTYRPRAITDTTTPLIYLPPKEAVKFLGIDTPGPFNSMVCRTTALSSQLFWGKPDYLPQDLLILTQLMAQGGFVFGNHITTRYRIHAVNASRGHGQKLAIVRYNCMVWYGIRWLAQFLLSRQICALEDIEAHGQTTMSELHVVPLVLALGSFDSPPALRAVAFRIFRIRKDMDQFSARFRLARRVGFTAIPVLEKISQIRSGWRPE